MLTNYEEARRRVNAVIVKIEAEAESGIRDRVEVTATVSGLRAIILEMGLVLEGSDEGNAQYRAYLKEAFILHSTEPHLSAFDPNADKVRGLVGIGPDCEIPDDIRV